MHAIADHVVDSYLDVTRLMECDIDAIEEETFSPIAKTDIEQIYLLKREVVELRRAVAPLSVELGRIHSDHKDLLSKEVLRYMRDVIDHQTPGRRPHRQLRRDAVTHWCRRRWPRSACSRTPTCARSRRGWRSPAVPTMIAGIYGMNFEHMPELSWGWGYPAVLLLMAWQCGFLYRNFRRNHWL